MITEGTRILRDICSSTQREVSPNWSSSEAKASRFPGVIDTDSSRQPVGAVHRFGGERVPGTGHRRRPA